LYRKGLSAQSISKNALGLRIGDNDGFGGEISYQRYLSENNRLEFDLGWRDSDNVDAFKLVGLYQWVFVLEDRFNWYVGAGAGIGSFDVDNDFDNFVDDDSGTFALVAGDIGIEYNFDIPLLLSLDIRPELGFNDAYSDDLDLDIALGIRYQF
jgi:hemolysin activation/secretion protein|tara:strand:- start:318 stop:776 length:459 start_codon:yes stop_codon:yes gene_type:complete